MGTDADRLDRKLDLSRSYLAEEWDNPEAFKLWVEKIILKIKEDKTSMGNSMLNMKVKWVIADLTPLTDEKSEHHEQKRVTQKKRKEKHNIMQLT